MNSVFKGYLQLCRPPNLPTAAADILAGITITGFFSDSCKIVDVLSLVFASIFLYAGGVVLNDVFDYELDKKERPERPIPSGLIKLKNASLFGFTLLGIGIIFTVFVNILSILLALLLALAIIIYDAASKRNTFFGPLNMGICRGLNLLLGISITGVLEQWYYGLIPVVFIFAVTLISRGEVHGNNKQNLIFSAFLYVMVILGVILLNQNHKNLDNSYFVFLLLFALMVFVPLMGAYQNNRPDTIKKAVKAGVLSLVVLDAAIATAFAGWSIGLMILILLPLSILLSKTFAVT
ncbi:MAG: UbiA-like protein EboC [Croceivirga sp.]